MAALLLIEWGYRAWREPAPVRSLPRYVEAPLFALFLWSIATGVWTGSSTVWNSVQSQSAFILFYWAACAVDSSETPAFFRWLCGATIVAGALGVVQHFTHINYVPHIKLYVIPEFFQDWFPPLVHLFAQNNERAVGPRSHPLTYAECFIPGFFLLLGWLVSEFRVRGWRTRTVFWLSLGMACVMGGILFAAGRAVWIGILVGTAGFAFALGKKYLRREMFVALVVVIPVVMFGSAKMRGRFLSIVSPTSGTLGDQLSKSTRLNIWHQAVRDFHGHPIVGVGLEGTRITTYDVTRGQNREWTETHNMYLQFLLELGVVGFGIFLWVLFACGKIIVNTSGLQRACFVGMFLSFLVAGLTESWPKDKEVAMLFWTMMGFASLLRKFEKS